MRNAGTGKEREERDVSFGWGTVFLLILFLFSNVYEAGYNRYLSPRFESIWAVYGIGLLLVLLPVTVLSYRRKEALDRWARSINLGILLIIAVTVATIFGTLVFQKRLPQEYIAAYGESLYRLFAAFHFIDLFHSVWFVNILFVLIVNIAYCYISRRAFNLRHLGGYALHFGIIVSIAGAAIGYIYGVKGVIQLNEKERVDSFFSRAQTGPPRILLGYELILDDFTIEWYEPKYLINTYRVGMFGGELISSLNVEKKDELTVAEAGVRFEVLEFSENGWEAGLGEVEAAAPAVRRSDEAPYPIVNVMIEDLTLRSMTREEVKASGWLAAYHEHRYRFQNVFETDAEILFRWSRPGELTAILEGTQEEEGGREPGGHLIVYRYGGSRSSVRVEPDRAYRLEGTPYIVRVTGYYPDFRIDAGQPYSASEQPRNPALGVEVTDTEHPGTEYRTTYLFARQELKGMMHRGNLPEDLELDYELAQESPAGGTKVYIIGEEEKVYVTAGPVILAESPIELGTPVPFEASGHSLLLSIQEFYVDAPLCRLVIHEAGTADTTVLLPLFSDPIRHRNTEFVSTFRRERDILDYKSRVRVFEDGRELFEETIEVNHPLVYGGYAIYQQSYDEVDWTWTGFEVVRDPGLWIVYTGFIMMCLGAVYVFYVRPRIGTD